MGRKHRRNVPPKEAKKWCRTEKGWELMSKGDKKLAHEKKSLKKP